MADDIVPELLERIQKEFSEKLKRSAVINRIEKLITEGKATYIEAHEYANKVGEILAQCFRDNISLESLPNGKLYYNIAERIINATLGHNYDIVTTVTAHIQKELNKQAEVSIIPQIPVKNQDRINGIIDYVSNAEKYDDKTRDFLEERAKNYTLSVVDDSVRENAKFHYNAGIRAKIIRTTYGHCCGWCANLAGTYDYADVSGKGNKVFQRHPYCKCTVEYISSMGRRENVWTHKTPGSDEDKAIRQKHEQRWKEKQTENSIIRKELTDKPRVIHKKDIAMSGFKKGSGKNYPVNISDSDYARFDSPVVEKVTVIAGHGVKEKLNDAPRLEGFYKQPKNRWQKISGESTIFFNGKSQKVEIHWYEANGQREEIKVKRLIKANES